MRAKNNLKNQQKKIKERIGNLFGYTPYIEATEISSTGTMTREFSFRFNRVIHLLSKIERDTLLRLEFDPQVTNVYEQYALDLETTAQIAHRLKVKHPKLIQKGTQHDAVMTTDFLVQLTVDGKNYFVAVDCKPTGFNVSTPKTARSVTRVIEKLTIAIEFWNAHGVEHITITSDQLDSEITKNLSWALSINREATVFEMAALASQELKILIDQANPTHKLNAVCLELDNLSGTPGLGAEALKYLLLTHNIRADLRQGLLVHQRISSVRAAQTLDAWSTK